MLYSTFISCKSRYSRSKASILHFLTVHCPDDEISKFLEIFDFDDECCSLRLCIPFDCRDFFLTRKYFAITLSDDFFLRVPLRTFQFTWFYTLSY